MKTKGLEKIVFFILFIFWILIGWPVILKNPRIPPELKKTFAATSEPFTSSGTFNAPTGIYSVTAACWGGGGAGGGSSTKNSGGAGGGGGEFRQSNVSVTPGNPYSVQVGIGGTGGSGNGGAGNPSSFNSSSVVANGGGGGGANQGGAGSGGSGGTGTTGYVGGNGAAATASASGGGGEGSGSSTNGINGNGTIGGFGTDGGDGGDGTTGGAGGTGTTPGGAGGGGRRTGGGVSGGDGADGMCVVTYTDTWAPSTNQTSYSNTWSFSTIPTNNATAQITMTATTGYDFSTPIEYFVTLDNSSCTSGHDGTGGNSSSSWQTSTSYSDDGLDPNKCYGYKVQSRDSASPQNTGTVSSISYTYSSANVPGAPTLSNPSMYTLDIDNDANNNPSLNPTTYFAAKVTSANPSDSTWLDKWVDINGNSSASEVWLTDSELDSVTFQNLNPGTTYGFSVKAKNNDGDITSLSTEGQGVTTTPIISVILTSDSQIGFGIVAPGESKSTLDLDPIATKTAQNDGNIIEDFKISVTDATDSGEGEDWILGTTPGYAFKYSTNSGGAWTSFITAGSYLTLAEDILTSGTQSFDLQVTSPTSPNDGGEKTVTITIMAVQPD